MISVILTLYNVENYIEETIDSILNQTYTDFELIVVNDCSTDNSLSIVKNIKDKRIKIINNKNNVGCGLSRRIGVLNAKGNYISFIDADDIVDSKFLETLYNVSITTDSDIVSCDWIEFNEDSSKIHTNNYGTYYNNDKYLKPNPNNLPFPNVKLYKSKLFKNYKYSELRFNEDYESGMILIDLANKTTYIDYIGYKYRQHQNSICHSYKKLMKDLYFLIAKINVCEWGIKHKSILAQVTDPIICSFILNDILEHNTKEDIALYSKEINIINNFIKKYL